MSNIRLFVDDVEIASVLTNAAPELGIFQVQSGAERLRAANQRAINAQIAQQENRATGFTTEADVPGHYPPLAIESPAGRECSTTNERISAGRDGRGYEFYCYCVPDGNLTVIRAGCRTWASFRDAFDHFRRGYNSDGDVEECCSRLSMLERVANMRGWLSRPQVATQVHETGGIIGNRIEATSPHGIYVSGTGTAAAMGH